MNSTVHVCNVEGGEISKGKYVSMEIYVRVHMCMFTCMCMHSSVHI